MSVFVRVAAILLGAANAISFSLIGASDNLLGDFAAPIVPGHLALFTLFAALAGLFVAEVVLRMMRRFLEGGFFGRYATMVWGVCAGGCLSGALLAVANLLCFADPAAMVFYRIPYLVLVGGALGLVEGLIAAFPLAAALGVLRNRG